MSTDRATGRVDAWGEAARGIAIGLTAVVIALPAISLGVRHFKQGHSPITTFSAVPLSPPISARAEFNGSVPTPHVKQVADWVADTNDNQGLAFAILDKRDAHVYVFDRGAHLIGHSPVLLGAAVGDDSAPGIGNRPLAQLRQHEKTTPAGRFESRPGHNAGGEDVVWVDCDAAVSIHRVRLVDPKEHRLERLASPTPDDNRISFGCINVPVAFFDTVVQPMLAGGPGVIYVLPETRPLDSTFHRYDVGDRQARRAPLARRVVANALSSGSGSARRSIRIQAA